MINQRLRRASALMLAIGWSALAAQTMPEPEAMVDEGTYQGVPWLSGGVGKGERDYLMSQRAGDFNLKLEFAAPSGAYLGDVQVTIAKPDGNVVVEAPSKGPWFMTRLPAGSYKVEAAGYGKSYAMSVDVPAVGLETLVFNQWPTPAVSTPGPGL